MPRALRRFGLRPSDAFLVVLSNVWTCIVLDYIYIGRLRLLVFVRLMFVSCAVALFPFELSDPFVGHWCPGPMCFACDPIV